MLFFLYFKYVAIRGERVIGVVVGKGAMSVNVDIGTSEFASLSLLAFESATKRNRPNIQVIIERLPIMN